MTLASLMGIVMFGTWREKSKDVDYFVVPAYDAIARNLKLQHDMATEFVYRELSKGSPLGAGIVPIFPADTAAWTDAQKKLLPPEFAHTKGYSSEIFCMNRLSPTVANEDCSSPDAVIYVMSSGAVPVKYGGAASKSIPKAIAAATKNARTIGLIGYSEQALSSPDPGNPNDPALGQPLGVHYYILSGGYHMAKNLIYLPNAFVCYLEAEKAVKDPLNVMIAMTLIRGPAGGQSIMAPGESELCGKKPPPP